MDAITFRFLMSLAASQNLEMYLMDVVTAYLYGSLENEIYMKIPEGLKMPEDLKSKAKEICSVRLQRSLYGLKQSGRMWYNRLSEYLLSKDYVNNAICPCVFIKKSSSGFVIIAVYVDDLNMIGTQKEIDDARTHMKEEFEMKDLGKTKFCLGLQIEHFQDGIFVHQSNYTKRVLKRFYMDKATPLSTPMVNRSLDVEKDPFRPCEDNEEVLGPEDIYQIHTKLDHKQVMFSQLVEPRSPGVRKSKLWLQRLQIMQKLLLSMKHVESVWLRSMTHHIQESSGIVTEKEPTKIFEDNSACVTQLKEGYIKSDRTKHIPPRFFSYTQELQKNQEVDIEYIRSSDNAADLFTKALPTTVFKKHVHSIGMRRLQNL
ncbi:unnamed protein product [Microthlaspi erraticum]|uniref:Reverse transcriptase Ty1/copia-type domain-containing protein n=1 Tax=Microthlaspi erraticum TaxID=1685480 RepID=A0A6D2KFM2_9BRAS|nr:unnamed protein product [Microthlaspi erraticum]